MKPMDGIKLLKHLKEYDHNAVVIIMTAYASTESAIQALKSGAFDYLQKPFRVDELIATLRRGIEFREFQLKRGEVGRDQVDEADIEARLIGGSKVMTKLRQQVARLASARAPVLLQGERGTGKTSIAEILHANGADENAELVRIDCALSTEDNFAKGLLGENGAGGVWVEKATGGTLLLQNLHALPFDLQPQLVSVLRSTAHRFRLICTCSEDLEQLTDEGKFHDELFYRVGSMPVTAPPLREHVEDLPAIIKDLLTRASNPEFDPSLIEFDEQAMAVLFRYRWPGNIAELQQMVHSIAAQTPSRMVSLDQIPLRQKSLTEWPSLEAYLANQKATLHRDGAARLPGG